MRSGFRPEWVEDELRKHGKKDIHELTTPYVLTLKKL
jgi:hypothetical protein